MNNTWLASDTHFGHANIIRYCNRPFWKVENMDSRLIDEWNLRVDTEDDVYFLGDFAMGPGVDDGFIVDKLRMLHGNFYVILGNHDQPNKRFGVSGLKQIVEDFSLGDKVEILPDIFEMHFEGQHFVMCHYPMKDWNDRMKGAVHLHGHTHTQYTPAKIWTMTQQKRYDVGVDMFGGPVRLTGDLRFLNDARGWE